LSTTELGTYDHPYKELNSVIVEMFNFHANSDRTINIKLAEGSTSYLMEGIYIINITSVIIDSYSKSPTLPGKAKITTVDSDQYVVSPGMPTMNSILSKFWIF